jgi:hypothetical protein
MELIALDSRSALPNVEDKSSDIHNIKNGSISAYLMSATKSAVAKAKISLYRYLMFNAFLAKPIDHVYTAVMRHRLAVIVKAMRPLLQTLLDTHGHIICHAHSAGVSYCTVVASQLMGRVRVVHTEHMKGGSTRELIQSHGEVIREYPSFKLLREQYSYLLEHVDVFVFPSFGAIDLFEEENGPLCAELRKKITVLHSGVEVNGTGAESTSTCSDKRLFAIAQHVPEKGLDRMLRAVAQAKDQGYRLSLRIAGGETASSPTLYALQEDLGLNAEISFLGMISHAQILKEIREADLFIACPRVVVFDLSLLEAMALGKPVLTSELPGNIEALGSDHPGYFASDDELPFVLVKLLNDSSLLSSMGRSNRQRYEKEFTLELMANRHWHLYASLLRNL